jgi:hypothetical protein
MNKVQRGGGSFSVVPLASERPTAEPPPKEPQVIIGWKPGGAVRRGPPADKVHDGYFIGAGGVPVGPLASHFGVKALMPANGKSDGLALFVNGVLNTKEGQVESMKALANTSGMAVIGLHNATHGFIRDTLQSAAEKVGMKNTATAELKTAISLSLARGNPIHLVAHSQGALVVTEALADAKRTLMDQEGLTLVQAEMKLHKLVTVETFGGAAAQYPDGPKYVHYVNTQDPVATWLGASDVGAPRREVGSTRARWADRMLAKVGIKTHAFETSTQAVLDAAHGYPGRNAVIKRFTDAGPNETLGAHIFTTYLKHREPLTSG